ncbi:MAG: cytochrome c5 family protein [Congregibacter sp.]
MLKTLKNVFLPSAMLLVAAAAVHAVDLTDEQRAEIAARISPVGEVCVQGESCGGLPAAPASAGAAAVSAVDGEATYNMACMACHSTGAGGAPMVGDIDAWAPRLAKGMEALHSSGVNGVAGTAMMAKGGRADLSDEAVIAAVDYMVNNSQ